MHTHCSTTRWLEAWEVISFHPAQVVSNQVELRVNEGSVVSDAAGDYPVLSFALAAASFAPPVEDQGKDLFVSR